MPCPTLCRYKDPAPDLQLILASHNLSLELLGFHNVTYAVASRDSKTNF